jgi:hypothetical protein
MKRAKSKDSRAVRAWWTEKQKMKFVRIFLTYGNLAIAAKESGIPMDTCRAWSYKDWFKEAVAALQSEDLVQRDANISRIVEKSLLAVEDRIENGDAQFNQATGEITRIPVKAHVALKISTELMNRQDKELSAPMKKEVEKTIDDRLAMLSQEFARFANMKVIDEVIGVPNAPSN